MKSSQSNFNLRSPGSYLARSYLIATVLRNHFFHGSCVEPWEPWDSWTNLFRYFVEELKAGKLHLNSRQIKKDSHDLIFDSGMRLLLELKKNIESQDPAF